MRRDNTPPAQKHKFCGAAAHFYDDRVGPGKILGVIAEGALSVLFGLFLFLRPGAGAVALIWVIGSFAILSGVILIALGFKLKGVKPASA